MATRAQVPEITPSASQASITATANSSTFIRDGFGGGKAPEIVDPFQSIKATPDLLPALGAIRDPFLPHRAREPILENEVSLNGYCPYLPFDLSIPGRE